MPSAETTLPRWSTRSTRLMRPRSKRWQRDRIVAGTLWTSVVASTNTTCAGGSSRVLRKASQVADVVDAAIGRRVDLDQIERPTRRHVRARRAGAAGVALGGPLAVHGLEQ